MHNAIRFAVLLLAAASCNQKESSATALKAEGSREVSDQVPNDFFVFYGQFHADSLYQIAHILWPLPGETTAPKGDSTQAGKRPHEWLPENWLMHKPIPKSGYSQEFSVMGTSFIIEKIRANGVNYGLERRFLKGPDDEWMLIFYSDMHEMKPQ